MRLAKAITRVPVGVHAREICVEVHLIPGIPKISIVGLPETVVRESRERVYSALVNSGFDFPLARIVINLAPADLPKSGGRLDLAIALGILLASGQLPEGCLNDSECVGELALSGQLRAVKGVMPTALACKRVGRGLFVPEENAVEAALVKEVQVFPARHLLDVVAHLRGEQIIECQPETSLEASAPPVLDLADIKGQQQGRRALEIAAAGNHSLLFIGPPGTGKTMLASRLSGLLPPLNEQEIMEVTAIYSVSGIRRPLQQRPFRSPHHSASGPALIGGGSIPMPGEVTLAHRGVLFLDELPEFSRKVLDTLREPLESGEVYISRARQRLRYPADFQMVAAMNPCPAGGCGDGVPCKCGPGEAERYQGRLSGPFLDRIDLHVWVPRLKQGELRAAQGESSAEVSERVSVCQKVQLQRSGKLNAALNPREIERWCYLPADDWQRLETRALQLNLSARAVHRLLRVARTIADLDGAAEIGSKHWLEAFGFRPRIASNN